jgi:hypothetical protein
VLLQWLGGGHLVLASQEIDTWLLVLSFIVTYVTLCILRQVVIDMCTALDRSGEKSGMKHCLQEGRI